MLYHLRHEGDRAQLMQAAALFTWHVGDGDTVTSGPCYWSGLATRIGIGLGMHRYSYALPATETSQYRRVWWTAFLCEVFSALETGRPCSVRAWDIDQLLITEEDIVDTSLNRWSNVVIVVRPAYNSRQPSITRNCPPSTSSDYGGRWRCRTNESMRVVWTGTAPWPP